MALDGGTRLLSLTRMDILSTHHLLGRLDRKVAAASCHWFFLADPRRCPKT
ncbi:hypothetical protein [Albidovulum sp.]|uniref:hypothetical protein n=1 Tax=Albidovulum sp. TaxID=1872424 RepID=UPI0039B9734F